MEKEITNPLTLILRDWYFSLPMKDTREYRKKIIDHCKINKYKWTNWLNGTSTLNKFERSKINEIIGYNLFAAIPTNK